MSDTTLQQARNNAKADGLPDSWVKLSNDNYYYERSFSIVRMSDERRLRNHARKHGLKFVDRHGHAEGQAISTCRKVDHIPYKDFEPHIEN